MVDPIPPYYWPPGAGTEPDAPPPSDQQVLGHDGVTYFVVQPDVTVVAVDPKAALSRRFVNSSPPQFGASVEALAARTAELARADSAEALLAITSLRHDLNRIDIAALGDRHHWWAVILDQLEEDMP